MARRGFLGRAASAVSRAADRIAHPFRRKEPPRRAPPPPPAPPPRRPPAPTGPPRNPYQVIWRATADRGTIREISQRTGDPEREIFRRHMEVFRAFPAEYDTEEERLEFWREYLEFMVNGNDRRNNPLAAFWQQSGIDPRSGFDWQAFRTAMGYRRRK